MPRKISAPKNKGGNTLQEIALKTIKLLNNQNIGKAGFGDELLLNLSQLTEELEHASPFYQPAINQAISNLEAKFKEVKNLQKTQHLPEKLAKILDALGVN